MPAAARQAGHGCALGIGLGVGEQHVEAAFHQEIEHADAGDAAQVEVGDAIVIDVRTQLAHSEKFGVERQHPALGEVDAAGLFVVHGLAAGVVAVGVEDGGGLFPKLVRLVEQGRDPEAGVALVAQLADGVAGTRLDAVAPVDLRLFREETLGVPAEEQVEDLGAQSWDLFAPGRSRRGGREVGQVLAEEGEELAMGLGADELSV